MITSPPAVARARRLKIAFGDLVHLIGDDTDAARITRVSRATIARYRSLSPADASFLAPVDVVADLERVTGRPLVTSLLCEVSGGAFEQLPDAVSATDVLTGLHNLSSEFNDVMGAVCAGLKDNHLCGDDADIIERELADMIRRATELRAFARSIKRGEK